MVATLLRIASIIFFAALGIELAEAQPVRPYDHVFLVVLGGANFDQVIGSMGVLPDQPAKVPLTPFVTGLAENGGLATLHFGLTHPALPNYLALLGGDIFGVRDENDSCAALPEPSKQPCHLIDAPNLIDQLESKGLTWVAYEQGMPTAGFLGDQYPGFAPRLYAQAHNPFIYFKNIASNPRRLGQIKPFVPSDFETRLSDGHLENFVFIAPDQCHDMRGTTTCADKPSLLSSGDRFLRETIGAIERSKIWNGRSIIFITWAESGDESTVGCCQSPLNGGGHVAFIALARDLKTKRSAVASNHYSVLRSIEDIFGLGYLANAAKVESVPATLLRAGD